MDCKNTIYLVGYTGVVGSNLHTKYKFDKIANSKDVKKMYGDCPDILVYSGVTGTKWYANAQEKADREVIESAILNIKEINPRKLVLISTVDVYDSLDRKDEDYLSNLTELHIYGRHRMELEQWVRNNIPSYHIVRLPAIFGENLRKNFICDLIDYIPHILNEKMYVDVNSEHRRLFGYDLNDYYRRGDDGLYYFDFTFNNEIKSKMSGEFRVMKHNALMFTNPKSEYQFYNLERLWDHIQIVIEKNIDVINLVSEPVAANDVCLYVDNHKMNLLVTNEIHYRLATKYAKLFENSNATEYLYNKEYVLEDIKKYIKKSRRTFNSNSEDK